jgi:exonuclease SbcD
MQVNLLHTADWHLGKDLYNYGRQREFEDFFSKLKISLRENNIDILIVSGDVFDTASPGNFVAGTYYGLINDLHNEFPDLEIIITGGNHDLPSYLNAPKEILKSFKVRVVGCVPRLEDGSIDFDSMVLEVLDNGGELKAVVCAVPFLRRGDFSGDMTVGKIYSQVVERALIRAQGKDVPIIATGHLTTSNAVYSTSSGGQTGGLDSIDSNEFPQGISYLALGHIHKPQPVDGKKYIRYSGSPIPFSFAEKDYKHSLTVVEFSGKEISEIRLESLPPLIPLLTVPETPQDLAGVKKALLDLPDDKEMYLEVNLLYEFVNPDNKAVLIEILKDKKAKFCTFKNNYQNGENSQNQIRTFSAEEFKNADPLKIMKEIFLSKQKTEMPDKYAEMLAQIIEEIN